MKALTLHQPFASLIVEGFKQYEFRGWLPPEAVFGQRVVVHAAAKKVDMAQLRGIFFDMVEGPPDSSMWCLEGGDSLESRLKHWIDHPEDLPLAAGLGTILISGYRTGDVVARIYGADGELLEGYDTNYAWCLAQPDRWVDPFPARGFQKLWNWTGPESVGA